MGDKKLEEERVTYTDRSMRDKTAIYMNGALSKVYGLLRIFIFTSELRKRKFNV